MEKGTTVTIIVLVFAVGLVFGGFSGINEVALGRATRSIDGYAASQAAGVPVLSIFPDIASSNDIMTGSVLPGANGALSGIKFFKMDEFGRTGSLVDECVNCFCKGRAVCYNREDFTYILPELDDGYYSACISDASTNQRACAVFQVN